jgi:hypothetical protein
MSRSNNIIHASDSAENAKVEIDRFFDKDELFSYKRVDWQEVYNQEEQAV